MTTNAEEVTIEVPPREIPRISSANLQAISERGPFKLSKLLILYPQSKNFLITDIKIGKNSQFISSGAIPASFFSESDHQKMLIYEVLPRGGLITISATNISIKRGEVAPPSPSNLPDPLSGSSGIRKLIRRIFGTRALPASVSAVATKAATAPVPPASDPFGALLIGEKVSVSYETACPCSSEKIKRRCLLGLGHQIVPPNGHLSLRLQPLVSCRPDLLVIPAEVAETCWVVAVRVVGENVLNDEAKVTQISTSLTLKGIMMLPGDWIGIEVDNKSSTSKAFYGTLVGDRCFDVTSSEQQERET